METILNAELFTEDGFIKEFKHWTTDVAIEMAKEDDLLLNDDHWIIINFLRDYYEEYAIAPAIRVLTKFTGKILCREKGNTEYLFKLFPYGPAKQACRYAGLPSTLGCI